MLKIGEFTKLSRVSVRMLRRYDEISLLKPAEIDRSPTACTPLHISLFSPSLRKTVRAGKNISALPESPSNPA